MQKAKLLLVFTLFFIGYKTSNAQSKYPSVLWEIKKGNSKPSYLFGTYHISSKGVFKLGDSIFYALKNVDIIAKEVNVNNWQKEQNSVDEMQDSYAKYTDRLREAAFNKSTVARTNSIEKLPFFISSQPSFVNYFLFRSNDSDGFEEEMFLDKFISSAGFKYGKDVKGLENYMESTILYLQAQKDQADLEKTESKQLPGGISYKEMNDKIYDGYLNNNLDAMDSIMVYQYESEAFYNKFLKERNYNQADSLDFYIKSGKTVFGAVGCAHLPGKDGVIEILRKKGYTLRPVKLVFTNTNELEAVKKTIIPLVNKPQNIDDVIKVNAPGTFYTYEKSDIVKSYGYVDMANSSFYYISRLYNNAAYFNYDTKKVSTAIDSLLFSNIKGDIVEKSFSELDGYYCVNVTTKVKNKDIERYKFVVTPYEIIKFQVGGKNEFAKAPYVDDFFNSIKITAPKKLADNYSFKFNKDFPIHVWDINNAENYQNKQRFTYYNAATKQLNSCIKVAIPEGKINKDSLISHMMRESFLSSETFPESYLNDYTKVPLASNQINTLKLQNGQTMLFKYRINLPYIYLISALKNESPTTDFIDAFELKDYTITNKQTYVDSSIGYKIMLPYTLNFDKRWKHEMERRKIKYEDDKNPNDATNIFYTPNMYGNNRVMNKMSFEDVTNMENATLTSIVFDKDSYYTSATEFWKKIMKPYEKDDDEIKEYSYNNNNYDEISTYSNDDDYLAKKLKTTLFNNYFNNGNNDKQKIENIIYDTASNKLQTVSFYLFDSIKNNKTYHQFKITNNQSFHLQFTQFGKEKTAFQKLLAESFAPLQNDKTITIFKSNFDEIIETYKKASLQKRPNVLKRLNNIFIGTKELGAINTLFKKYNKNTPEDNILRRKLMGMVSNGLYAKKDWTIISNWMRTVFNDKNELVTLRNFALLSIISKQKLTDADWLITNLYKNNSVFQKNVASDMQRYFRKISPKKEVIAKLPLILNDKDDYRNVGLIDSGYYNIKEREKAFEFYKKKLEDETLNIKLAEEKNNFVFKESEINETLSNNKNNSNFRQFTTGFILFYASKPKDVFFEDAFNKILNAKADKDLLNILDVFLKQPAPDYAKVDKIVAQVGKEKDNLVELNSTFFKNKKYDKLPIKFKDKIQLAKSILLSERSYNKLDSVTFISAEKYLYSNNDSVYFFKYISNKQKNSNIAFIILDNKNEFLTGKPDAEFTNEQITASEPYEKIVKKLMQENYTKSYFYGRNNFYQLNKNSKSLYSEE